jgi:hypothetical protein
LIKIDLKGELVMGNPVNLTAEQKVLKDRLYEMNQKLWEILKDRRKPTDYEAMQPLYHEMAETAHELHMSLKDSGNEPKHHKYMLENRGVPVEDIEFYNHIHPVDDLLKFIDDINANDDPEDTTIGKKFTLKIYTRRWGHYDHYSMVRTEHGWDFQEMLKSNSGECGKDGNPNLCRALEHDNVCYPKQIGDFFEYLWEQASEGLTAQEVQECFDMLGEWISTCEMNTPRGIFGGLI